MSDLFNRVSDAFGGSFSADGAYISFAQTGILGRGPGVNGEPGGVGVGMLAQNLNFSYNQQITRIYEIGTVYSFYVIGRTAGALGMARVLGPRPVSASFYEKYGDGCNAATNLLTLTMASGCDDTGSFGAGGAEFDWSLLYCVITSIAVSVTAQDAIINEQLQMMYCSLNLDSSAGSGGLGTSSSNDPSTDPNNLSNDTKVPPDLGSNINQFSGNQGGSSSSGGVPDVSKNPGSSTTSVGPPIISGNTIANNLGGIPLIGGGR